MVTAKALDLLGLYFNVNENGRLPTGHGKKANYHLSTTTTSSSDLCLLKFSS